MLGAFKELVSNSLGALSPNSLCVIVNQFSDAALKAQDVLINTVLSEMIFLHSMT